MELMQPVQMGDEEIREINLRAPTVKDIDDFGMPYRVGMEDGALILSSKACRRYINRLGQVPMPVVDKLSAGDFTRLSWELLSFFGESPETETK